MPYKITDGVYFTHLLRVAHDFTYQTATDALKPLKLPPKEWGVLYIVNEDKLIQQDIAHQLRLNINTVVKLLDELERKGLAKREQNPDDRRQHFVTLTLKGKALLPKAAAALSTVSVDNILKSHALTKEEFIQLFTIMRKFVEAIPKRTD